VARKTLTRPGEDYDKNYLNYLISEIEYQTGITFNKGERIQVGGGDSTELVLVSPNGTKYKVSVADNGTLSTSTTV
jgi:uncharacterized cupredoxin-like copper-binding protein|tara:strand:+ start:228 stop:455 length:228 start_codon:yes stop_codon:yes gene_type:complete